MKEVQLHCFLRRYPVILALFVEKTVFPLNCLGTLVKNQWIFLLKILFIFDCTGSSLQWASHCGGFSCCGAQALGHAAFSSCGSQALEHRLNSCGSWA